MINFQKCCCIVAYSIGGINSWSRWRHIAVWKQFFLVCRLVSSIKFFHPLGIHLNYICCIRVWSMLQFDPEKQECTKLPRLFYYRYNILTSITAVQFDSHGYVSVPAQRSHAYWQSLYGRLEIMADNGVSVSVRTEYLKFSKMKYLSYRQWLMDFGTRVFLL